MTFRYFVKSLYANDFGYFKQVFVMGLKDERYFFGKMESKKSESKSYKVSNDNKTDGKFTQCI